MEVLFLYHSAVMITTQQHVLLFDAYQMPLPHFPEHKKVYLFYTHQHHDHFSQQVFAYQQPHMTICLSDDITPPDSSYGPIQLLHAHEKIILDDLLIETLESNDQGLAYVIHVDQQLIYHSGDLNDWHWHDEDDQRLAMLYHQELAYLKDRHFDLACIPLDGRLGSFADGGIMTFLQYASAKMILPIHCWGQNKVIDTFIHKHPEVSILPVQHDYALFHI